MRNDKVSELPGSVFNAQDEPDCLEEVHEIVEKYSEEAVKLAAEEVGKR